MRLDIQEAFGKTIFDKNKWQESDKAGIGVRSGYEGEREGKMPGQKTQLKQSVRNLPPSQCQGSWSPR